MCIIIIISWISWLPWQLIFLRLHFSYQEPYHQCWSFPSSFRASRDISWIGPWSFDQWSWWIAFRLGMAKLESSWRLISWWKSFLFVGFLSFLLICLECISRSFQQSSLILQLIQLISFQQPFELFQLILRQPSSFPWRHQQPLVELELHPFRSSSCMLLHPFLRHRCLSLKGRWCFLLWRGNQRSLHPSFQHHP